MTYFLMIFADDSEIICDIYRNTLDMMGHSPLGLEALKNEAPDLAQESERENKDVAIKLLKHDLVFKLRI